MSPKICSPIHPFKVPGMSQFAALVVELAAKLGQAVPSAKVPQAAEVSGGPKCH